MDQKDGTYIYLGLNHIVVLQKPTQPCKGIILHLKNKDFKKITVILLKMKVAHLC